MPCFGNDLIDLASSVCVSFLFCALRSSSFASAFSIGQIQNVMWIQCSSENVSSFLKWPSMSIFNRSRSVFCVEPVFLNFQNSLQTTSKAATHHLAQPNMGIFKGGSLPNVNQMANQMAANTIDLQVGA